MQAMLASVPENHLQDQPLLVPAQDLPTLHYYFPSPSRALMRRPHRRPVRRISAKPLFCAAIRYAGECPSPRRNRWDKVKVPSVSEQTPVWNIASVDVEDYFHVEAFARVVDRARWPEYTPRVEANTRRLLDLFDEANVRGTFFILGWVAERFPALVREIAARGHETACHSYWHRLVFGLTPEEFREDTNRAKQAIEDACGQSVVGYRAPSFSITRQSRWALEILVELGFLYDSSIFPIQHDIYGVPRCPAPSFSDRNRGRPADRISSFDVSFSGRP